MEAVLPREAKCRGLLGAQPPGAMETLGDSSGDLRKHSARTDHVSI